MQPINWEELKWLWWLAVSICLLWWWPKHVQGYFQAQLTLEVPVISVNQTSDLAQILQLEPFDSSWSILELTSQHLSELNSIDLYTFQNNVWQPLLGCHQESDLQQSNFQILGWPCHLVAGRWAVPSTESIFYFRSGTYLEIKPIGYRPKPGQLIINEVMWAGSFRGESGLVNDEWIELYNNSDQSLSLQNVVIAGATISQGELFLPDKVIPPNSYFLITRQNILTTPQITSLKSSPDWFAPLLRLSNSQANLVVYHLDDPTSVLDQTPSGVWQAGVNDLSFNKRASAQRCQPVLVGQNWSSWGTCLDVFCSDIASWQEPYYQQNLATPGSPNICP